MSGDRISPHELRRTFEVWREVRVSDGQGGTTVTMGTDHDVQAKVNQPTTAEQVVAQQSGVELLYAVHMLPDADVRRGDELRGDGEVFKVRSTVVPSDPVYLRADCTRQQAEV